MIGRSTLVGLAFLLLLPVVTDTVGAQGLTKAQASRFDADGDNYVDADKVTVYIRHRANAVLAKYDADLSGEIEPDELGAINADAAAAETALESADIRLRAQQGVRVPLETSYDRITVAEGSDIGPRFYLREKRVDIGISGDPLQSVGGASLAHARDFVADRTTVTVKGAAGILYRNSRVEFPEDYEGGDLAVTAYAFGPFVEANGTISTANTTLTVGAIGQVELFGGSLIDLHLISAAPYYQTDFDGDASIVGGAVSWQPFSSELALGTYRRIGDVVDVTWSLVGEVDYLYVSDPGATRLKADDHHLWIGFDAEAEFLLLPERFDGRLYARGGYSHYYDVISGDDAGMAAAKAGYYLNPSKNAAVQVEDGRGSDHNTRRFQEFLKTVLTLKY